MRRYLAVAEVATLVMAVFTASSRAGFSADSIDDFPSSAANPSGNWTYGHTSNNSDPDAFVQFPNNWWTGNTYWKDPSSVLQIRKDWEHPVNGKHCVRRYTTPEDAVVTISYTVEDRDWDSTPGNGIDFGIYIEGPNVTYQTVFAPAVGPNASVTGTVPPLPMPAGTRIHFTIIGRNDEQDDVTFVHYTLTGKSAILNKREVVADYLADYRSSAQGGPPANWKYQWATDGAPTTRYNMLAYQTWWAAEGAWPSSSYGYLGLMKIGSQVGTDCFAIAGYTVQESGMYELSGSVYQSQDGSDNGVELRIYSGNQYIHGPVIIPPKGTRSFEMPFWLQSGGRTMYVCVGDNGDDTADGFDLDFTIKKVIPRQGSTVLVLH